MAVNDDLISTLLADRDPHAEGIAAMEEVAAFRGGGNLETSAEIGEKSQ